MIMNYGKAIAIIRGVKGLSIQDFAKETGLSKSFVSRVEKGERNLAESTVHEIAQKLNIPVRMFFLLANTNISPTAKTAQEVGTLLLQLLEEQNAKTNS